MLHLSRILKKRLIFIFFGNIFINKQTLNGLCLNQFKQGEIMKIRFICDPSHGWGEIPISLINDLGLTSKISNYSYKKDVNAYLEEDCDLPMVLRELKKQGIEFSFIEEHSNNDSWVRNLKKFN